MSGFNKLDPSYIVSGEVPFHHAGSTCDAYTVNVGGKLQFVKCLKKNLQNDPVYCALFKKEYEIGKDLSHPNLVHYTGIGQTDEGISMTMDYVDGRTLADELENDPGYFSKEKAVKSFLEGVFSCLSYLHSKQIIHLDLKPENIMLRRIDNSPVIIDLGFCYTDAYSAMTGGSDEYAAPEQFSGSPSQIDGRTDLFAVGKIIEKIDSSVFAETGRHISRTFLKLAHSCTQENMEMRPENAERCLETLRSMHRMRFVMILVTALLALAAAAALLSGRHFTDRDGTEYRIVSFADRTCEVKGWHRPHSDTGYSVYIKPEIELRGKSFKTISIADKAFEGDSSIVSVFIPEGVESLGALAFHDCRGLSSLTIPNTVKSIGHECFWDARRLEEVVLPASIEMLDYNTFVHCDSLRRISIPEGVTSIGKDCFVSCHSLAHVALPESLEEISRGAFYDCSSLESITIPASVSSIGDYAFIGCTSLQSVTDCATTPQRVTDIFGDISTQLTLYVPAASLSDYAAMPVWGECDSIKEIIW